MAKKNRPVFASPPATKKTTPSIVTPTPTTPTASTAGGNVMATTTPVPTMASTNPTDDDAFAHLLDKVIHCHYVQWQEIHCTHQVHCWNDE